MLLQSFLEIIIPHCLLSARPSHGVVVIVVDVVLVTVAVVRVVMFVAAVVLVTIAMVVAVTQAPCFAKACTFTSGVRLSVMMPDLAMTRYTCPSNTTRVPNA